MVFALGCTVEMDDADDTDLADASQDASKRDAASRDGATGAETGRSEGGVSEGGASDVTQSDRVEEPDVVDPPDAQPGPDASPGPEPCPDGVICVDNFVFAHEGTTVGGRNNFSSYKCSETAGSERIQEAGPEVVYRVQVPAAGFLSVAVEERGGHDIDVHILKALDSNTCVSRGDLGAKTDVNAGIYYVVADTYSGKSNSPGPYKLRIGFVEPSVGPCSMKTGVMRRGKNGSNHLNMPATGPMVMEAHLVTKEEPPPYPMSARERLGQHYALSESRTKFVMPRKEPWAPLEGGSHYGCGIGSPADFPVLDEGWYVNMMWHKSTRPSKGTKMIVRLPGSNRAVVVAAGYETGPGNLSHIGGTTEETHYYLGTKHLGNMKLGIASDQSLPFGPRTCTD